MNQKVFSIALTACLTDNDKDSWEGIPFSLTFTATAQPLDNPASHGYSVTCNSAVGALIKIEDLLRYSSTR